MSNNIHPRGVHLHRWDPIESGKKHKKTSLKTTKSAQKKESYKGQQNSTMCSKTRPTPPPPLPLRHGFVIQKHNHISILCPPFHCSICFPLCYLLHHLQGQCPSLTLSVVSLFMISFFTVSSFIYVLFGFPVILILCGISSNRWTTSPPKRKLSPDTT